MENLESKSLLPPSWKKMAAWVIGSIIAFVLLFVVGIFSYISWVNQKIDQRMDQLHSARSSYFYSLYPPIRLNQRFTDRELRAFLEDQGYVLKRGADELKVGEYMWDPGVTAPTRSLTLIRAPFSQAGHPLDKLRARLTFEDKSGALYIRQIQNLDTQAPVEYLECTPKQIGAFFAGRLRTQNSVALSDIPVSVRMAVMAIEDINFLEHHGVSLRGTLRAIWQDLRAGKYVQGGSTITQQLMKNFFFSREKAISRKFKELLFALLTEIRHSKEDVLEAYLNEVYLGQWSTHEIHGVSEGARYYFNRHISQLSLAQSATLAAIVQAPNSIDPRRYPDRAIKRRNLVLQRMLDAEFILPDEFEKAIIEPIGTATSERSLDDVDYFIDLVMEKLPSNIKSRLDSDALTVYVTLSPALQAAASHALANHIERLTASFKELQDNAAKGIRLQSALIAISVKDCSVLALQGGRSFRQTQFNRILQGKRQPGSLFKPFAYLAGFQSANPPITPLTEIEDAPFEWKYEGGQVWTPKNYDDQFRGIVTVRQALEQSINVPTAKVAQMAGVSTIYKILTKAGIRSNIPQVPSLSLGSADVTPLEVAEAFTTLANLGKSCSLRPFVEIYDENKNIVLENKPVLEERLPLTPTFQTVHMMKGAFTHGTAKSALSSGLKLDNFAGKTGTTSDYVDAWFVGFSPSFLTLVWVGYDEEQAVGLSGATAALPLWVDFLRSAGPYLTDEDFQAPPELIKLEIDETSRSIANPRCPQTQTEYFVRGTEPRTSCPLH